MKVTNSIQFEKLVEELEKKPALAKGLAKGFKGRLSPSNFKESWEDIATKLNALGPPSRDGDGWQKVWRDLKFKVKKKLTHNKAEMSATGGGLKNLMPIGAIEVAVASLLNWEKQINLSGIFVGVTKTENVDMDDEDLPTSSKHLNTNQNEAIETNEVNVTTPKPRNKSSKEHLLTEHHEMQKRMLREMSSSMKRMENHFRDVARCSRDRLEIAQRKAEREEELFEIELEIKKKKLEALRRQLK